MKVNNLSDDINEYLKEVHERLALNIAYAFLCGEPTIKLIEAIEYDVKELTKYNYEW